VGSSLRSGPSTPQSLVSFPPSVTNTPVTNSSQTCPPHGHAFPPEEFTLPQSPVMPLCQPAALEAPEKKSGTSRKRQRAESSCSQPQRKRRVSSSGKKERKKVQNKTAALRYRQKKKEEKKDVDFRQQELEETNRQLRSTFDSLRVEISYLRKLWEEVEKAKTEEESSLS